MFEFPEVLDSIDAVPEEYKVAYDKNAEGKFALRDAFKPFATGIVGNHKALQTKAKDLQKAQGESAQRRQVIKAFEDLLAESGVSVEDGKSAVDALKEHMSQLAASAKNGGELKVNLEKLKADYTRQADAIRAEADTSVKKMQVSLEKHMIGDAARSALAKHKGSAELLLPLVRSMTKVVQEGEDFVPRVVDTDGTIRIDPKTGQAMTVEALVAEMKNNNAYARAFESEAKGGTGTTTQTQSRSTGMRTQETKEKSSVSKIASALAARGR